MRSTIGTVVRVTTLLTIASSLAAQTSWTRIYPTPSPSPRMQAGFVFDSLRGVVVLVGGYNSTDAWQWNGTNWSLLPPGPSARSNPTLAFDAARGRVVLFGGQTTSLNLNDTWTWDGAVWAQRFPAHSPSFRISTAAAFDPVRSVVAMFGGDVGGTLTNELWEWSGSDWVQRGFANGPTARALSAMAFDPSTAKLLVFGGMVANPNTPNDETWLWDGIAWQQRFPSNMPYARYAHSMATDTARRRVVLYGTYLGNDPFAWEWDGSTWAPQFLASPTPRSYTQMTFDSARGQVVLFGGVASVGSPILGDTWIYRTASPASFTAYGTGCGTPLPPVLAPQPYNLPWLGDTFRTQVANLPQTAGGVFFLLGLASTPANDLTALGFPGCSTFVTLDESVFVPVTAGAAVRTLTVPNVTALAGLHVFEQAAVLDSASPNGLALSNAGELVLGIR